MSVWIVPPLRTTARAALRAPRHAVAFVTTTLPLSSWSRLLQFTEANPTTRFVAETDPPATTTELLDPKYPTYNVLFCQPTTVGYMAPEDCYRMS